MLAVLDPDRVGRSDAAVRPGAPTEIRGAAVWAKGAVAYGHRARLALPMLVSLAVGIGFLALSAIPGLLLIEVERMQIAITEDAIVRHSPWTGRCVVKWSDVARVGYSRVNRWFVVSSTGGTVRVSQHFTGIGEFVKIARRKLTAERYSGAASAFDAWS